MTCNKCVGKVQRALSGVPGVLGVRVNLNTGEAEVVSDIAIPIEVRAWESGSGSDIPQLQLLVVSTGTVAANKAMGLRSRIVLDPLFDAGRAFGARGTPSAVLIDSEGKIASPVAAGGAAIAALLSRQREDGSKPSRGETFAVEGNAHVQRNKTGTLHGVGQLSP
jgi:cation transport ATPase